MAVNKAKQAISNWQLARRALSRQPLALSKTKRKPGRNTASKTQPRRKRRPKHCLRFSEAVGKTVEFVEMWADADFPCVDIGFKDKTALHFVVDTRLIMEATYSNWKTGNQRIRRRWPAVECR